MYSSRRQRRVSSGMHGSHPDAAAQLHRPEHDYAYDRQQQSFTLQNGRHAPPSIPRTCHSHTLPSHGYNPLCSNEQKQVYLTNSNTTYNAMMDPVPDDIFDNLPSARPGLETLSARPSPLPDFSYREFIQDLEAAQTVSPKDLSIHPTDHYPTTPHRQPLIQRAASQSKPSSSIKSSSHISTPSLTPQTPNGSCSTPETSIDGAAGDIDNAVVAFRPKVPGLQRYKTILPAPTRHDSLGEDVNLPTQMFEWPQIPTQQALSGEPSLRDSFLAPNYLPSSNSSGVAPNGHKQVPGELDWLGSRAICYDQPEFVDASKIFDLDFDVNHDPSNDDVMSKYPPLTDTRNLSFDLNASHDNLAGSQYGQGLYLPNLSSTMDDDLFAANASHPYTDIFDTDETPGLYQSIEPRVAGTECGEGSRRDTSRDDELLRLRRQGISYREIKSKYGFTEAESTLRGRYRTLTKSKDRRVRKPVWKDRDIHSLCDVVYHLAKQQGLCLDARRIGNWLVLTSEHTLNKISWKKVTQAMEDRGSYPYGFTTTKKKYFDVGRGKV